jgi:hypothetical protein
MSALNDNALFLPKNSVFGVGMQVDTARVERALNLIARSTTGRLADRIWYLARDTTAFSIEETRRLEPAAIDQNLQVTVISYTNASRNRISKAKRGTAFTRVTSNKPVPLGVLVIMARHRAGSLWNTMTDNRWSLAGVRLPTGPGTALARQGMIEAELTRMIRSRHSSTSFLKSGWKHAYRALKKLRPASRKLGGGYIDVEAQVVDIVEEGQNEPLGVAFTSGLGTSLTPWIRIENAIGTEGTPNLARRRQAWLFAVGGPALQRALNRAVNGSQAHYLDKQLGDDLRREWESL